MPPAKENAKIIVSIPKQFKEFLQECAEKENRSVNNYIYTVLLRYHEEKGMISHQ